MTQIDKLNYISKYIWYDIKKFNWNKSIKDTIFSKDFLIKYCTIVNCEYRWFINDLIWNIDNNLINFLYKNLKDCLK